MRLPKRFMCGLTAALLVAVVGCNSSLHENKAPSQTIVEKIDETPSMTPAELGRRFRQAYSQGLELASVGRYGLAMGAFEDAVKLRPSSVEALFNLGACREALGDPLGAIEIYRRVLTITPNDADCYANLGTSFIKMYYREKSPIWRKMAREAWNQSLSLKPDQPNVRDFLAMTEKLD